LVHPRDAAVGQTTAVNEPLADPRVDDPFRWLEADTPATRAWQAAQGRSTDAAVRAWPHHAAVLHLVRHMRDDRFVTVPRHAAGQWFRMERAEGERQSRAIVSTEPFGPGRVLFEPTADGCDRPPFLSWVSPSPDASTLALGVCKDGSEMNTVRLVDVTTATLIPGAPEQTLMDNWLGGAQWLPDSSGFFFGALSGPGRYDVFFHDLRSTSTSCLELPWSSHDDYRAVFVSPDGLTAVAFERVMNPLPVAWTSLAADRIWQWQPFGIDPSHSLWGHVVGDRLVAVTTSGAPKGRLVEVPLSPDAADPRSWQELVAESTNVLRTVTPVGHFLYLTEFDEASYAHVRIVDATGRDVAHVPLPGKGALSELPGPLLALVPRGHRDEFIFAQSTLTSSWTVLRHRDAHSADVEVLQQARVVLDGATIWDRRAVSGDGTSVPYQIVAHGEFSGAPRPTLIYAYGGFNVPWLPQYPSEMAPFIAAGGVFVLAHLRGGGEFGAEWWDGGRLTRKQRCFDDLFAVAEDLVAQAVTTTRQLAVTGSSNGGLLAAVAATQRPDLWAAVVPRVPLTDLIAACKDPYGRTLVTREYADVAEPEEVRRLASFSPYHLVRPRPYPAVYVDAGDTDPRCPAWHARKLVAAMQAAQSGAAPILLRVWENVGHGWATDNEVAIEQNAAWLSFIMMHTGLDPTTVDEGRRSNDRERARSRPLSQDLREGRT
jgi:prolyl oligopeptidase